jgi:hypothetical protein
LILLMFLTMLSCNEKEVKSNDKCYKRMLTNINVEKAMQLFFHCMTGNAA